jgi:phosphatidylglycerophosphate synthase
MKNEKYSNFIKLRLDDRFTSYILDRTSFFSNISPNLITFVGFILNFAIYIFVDGGFLLLSYVALLIRYLADCLDGGVARKYNKKSKFGGLFDSISDSVLIFICVLLIFKIYDFDYGFLIASLAMVLNISVMAKLESLTDHAGMKTNGYFLKNIYAFSVNNSFILFLAMILAIYCSSL